MRKITLLTALLCAALGAVTAQQEIPRFFDTDAGGQISSAVFSPDGRTIAVAQGGVILFYDAANGREIRRLPKQNGEDINDLVYSPDGRRLAASAGGSIKIWNTENGEAIRTITLPVRLILCLACSPDGSRIAAGIPGGDITLLNAATGAEIQRLSGHTGNTSSVVYSPDGRQLLSASSDSSIKIWDAGTGRVVRTINGTARFLNAAYRPDGRRIAAVHGRSKNTVKLYDPGTGAELRDISTGGDIYLVEYSPDGRQLLVNGEDAHGDDVIKLLDAETGRELRTINSGSYQAVFSGDGQRIVTVYNGMYTESGWYRGETWATVWDAANGRKLLTVGYGPLNAGARAYADLQVARFLGDTAAAKRHEAILQFITGRGNATRAEIEAYLRGGIAAVVNATYNTVLFSLDMVDKSYDTYLTQNLDRSYTIRYDLNNIENDDEEFTRPNLDALLDELKKRGFTSGNCDTVRRQSALFPALSRIDGVTDDKTRDLVKYALTGFYTANDQTARLNNYKALLAIYNRYNSVFYTDIAAVGRAMRAMEDAITALSPELIQVFDKDARHVVAVSRQQSQQSKARLMSNDVNVLASTVGEVEAGKQK
ncbi:MAG: WD40 repeat domain-containing protein [Spirochaetaceae bacterium]|jgi:Tol biopolymer transport system component|nr:WD40 repeat domain-containing protein [Spirochaetaceae bacterium]